MKEAKFDFISNDLLASNVLKTAYEKSGHDLITGLHKMKWNISRKEFEKFFAVHAPDITLLQKDDLLRMTLAGLPYELVIHTSMTKTKATESLA